MVSVVALRGHLVHFVVFGLPVVGLVGAIGLQEIRARLGRRHADEMQPGRARLSDVRFDGSSSPGLRFAALGLAMAAAIHAVVAPEHFREDLFYGLFFVVVTAVQIALAVVLTVRPGYRIVRCAAVASAWIVVLYMLSRTSGVPVGPASWRPESFGVLDIAATCAELVTLVGCLTQLLTVSNKPRWFAHRSPGLTP